MNNVFTVIMSLAKQLNQSTINKLQKNVDAFLDNLGTEEKPLNHPEFFLPHSNSLRYANGNYIQDFAETSLINDDNLQTAKDLYELHHTYTTESAVILKYLKATAMRLILLLAEATNEQIIQLLLDIFPEFIKQDSNLLQNSGLEKDEIEALQKNKYSYNSLFASKEEKDAFLDELKDEHVFELMQKYYALELLTNF